MLTIIPQIFFSRSITKRCI